MTRILSFLAAMLFSVSTSAQTFQSGQVLTAAALNSALAAKTTNSSAAITGGTIAGLTSLYVGTLTNFNGTALQVNGSISVISVGAGFRVAEGSNARQGTVTLVGGTATVSNTTVTANSRIFLTSQADGGTPGFVRVSSRVAGTSFTITSSSGTDTSTIAYEIFEPN